MRSRLVAALFVVGGCHKLLDLEHVDNPTQGDAALDDGTMHDPDAPDSMLDAFACTTVQRDEDNDGIDDRCDGCPTISSDEADTDGDGVPNDCDPDLVAGGDAILFVALFSNAADLDEFSRTNATLDGSGDGRVQLSANGALTTMGSYAATRIEVNVNGVAASTGAEIDVVNTGNLECRIVPGNCAMGTGTCVTTTPASLGSSTIGSPMNGLTRIRLGKLGSGTSCTMTVAGAQASGQSANPLVNSTFSITTNSTAIANVRSVVIYGAKL